MKIYSDLDNYSLCCACGDIHGEFDALLGNLKRFPVTDALILVAGDCGIGFEAPSFYEQLYNRLEKTLTKLNCCIFLMRGNHDNPACFEKESLSFPRMKTIPDYSVVLFRQRTILCVGGAISIDRQFRLSLMRLDQVKRKRVRELYWELEAPRYNANELEQIHAAGLRIDTVITHSAPSFCSPTDKKGIENWISEDHNLAGDIDKERYALDNLYGRLLADKHPLSHWYYGHFHNSCVEIIDGVCFSMLNIFEIKEMP